MDFVNRSAQPAHNNRPSEVPAAAGGPNFSAVNNGFGRGKRDQQYLSKWFRIGSIVLLFSVTAVIVALVAFFAFWNNNQESKFVNKNEYQAVVLVNVNGTTGGQNAYFGHIQDLTDHYIRLTNVFYIQSQGTSSTNSSSS